MAEPSSALYDFGIATHGDVALDLLVEQIRALQEKHAQHPPTVELYGRSSAGEILVLYRFPFAVYSAALRQRMQKEAERLKGRLVEPEMLASEDKARFYGERLAAFDVRVDATSSPRQGVEAFRARMGLEPGAPVYQLQYGSSEDIAAAWARCVAEGSLFVPARRLPRAGDQVRLLLSAPGASVLDGQAQVLEVVRAPEPGFLALFSPGPELQAFVARAAAQRRQGRLRGHGGRRRHPRYDSFLEVSFADYPELKGEYAANISKGGLFIRATQPPPLRAHVRLRLRLPDGSCAETMAEVVHVVRPEEAAARRCSAGVGVSFASDPAFLQRIERAIPSFDRRKPRVLVADDDRFFRIVLSEALSGAGMEVEQAADGQEALQKLVRSLLELDVVVLDLQMPGLDGYCLIDRIRRLGGEMELGIVVLSAASQLELDQLQGPGAADEAIRKGTALDEIVRRIERLACRQAAPSE